MTKNEIFGELVEFLVDEKGMGKEKISHELLMAIVDYIDIKIDNNHLLLIKP